MLNSYASLNLGAKNIQVCVVSLQPGQYEDGGEPLKLDGGVALISGCGEQRQSHDTSATDERGRHLQLGLNNQTKRCID